VSSQVGCSMACTFCHTGTQGLVRNLKPSEIVGQVMAAKTLLYDFPASTNKVISNLVFMGQGEPVRVIIGHYQLQSKADQTILLVL